MTILSFNEFLEELKTPKEGGLKLKTPKEGGLKTPKEGGMMTPREKAANARAAKKKMMSDE